jgi:hypothetical protein
MAGLILHRFMRTLRRERGQVLMMAVVLLPVLLGMAGMAVDVGSYADHRRQLQNAADSAALAGAQELPSSSAAVNAAENWGAKNGIAASDMTITVTGVGGAVKNPKITVQIDRPHDFSFIKVLGIKNANVKARAAAIKTNPGGAAGLTPWAITEASYNAASSGALVTLKYDASGVVNGNFGAIRIDGNGSAVYEATIKDGSKSVACSQPTSGCGETSPVCNDYVCPSETGNKVGATRAGVDYAISTTDSHCDTFAEVFTGPVSGKYELVNQCNRWLDGSYTSRRVIVVPIIKNLCNGSCDLTILSFALFWLEGYDANKCTGNTCEIKGRFVNADANINALTGVYNPNSSLTFVRLSE